MVHTDAQINEMTPDEAQKAIEKLEKMSKDCVGWLYPSIIQSEIEKLELRKEGKFVKIIDESKNKYKFINK